mmetsp:Transcript_15032/g.32237  ORF Transcript_15032/g.32237 Transcript_15032/m.32237 type:complete len:238 (+) Transcript_15032:570-1283(+)
MEGPAHTGKIPGHQVSVPGVPPGRNQKDPAGTGPARRSGALFSERSGQGCGHAGLFCRIVQHGRRCDERGFRGGAIGLGRGAGGLCPETPTGGRRLQLLRGRTGQEARRERESSTERKRKRCTSRRAERRNGRVHSHAALVPARAKGHSHAGRQGRGNRRLDFGARCLWSTGVRSGRSGRPQPLRWFLAANQVQQRRRGWRRVRLCNPVESVPVLISKRKRIESYRRTNTIMNERIE